MDGGGEKGKSLKPNKKEDAQNVQRSNQEAEQQSGRELSGWPAQIEKFRLLSSTIPPAISHF